MSPHTTPTTSYTRLRGHAGLRSLVRETRLDAGQLVWPAFVTDDPEAVGAIASLPGVERHDLASFGAAAAEHAAAGVRAVLLFGVPRRRSPNGEAAWDPQGPVPRALELLERHHPQLARMADVCLCAYREDGHCGAPLPGSGDGRLDTAATAALLAKTAVAYAEAGAHVVAPSARVDGMVAAIRQALDGSPRAAVRATAVLSYAAKLASSFYGPFRDAARSAPASGDRRAHQIDPANAREALAEVAEDLRQGADMLMIKPGLPALDVLCAARQAHPAAKLIAYQVSGELAMLRAAAQAGVLDERATLLESLLALRRGGADAIVTYAALDAARWLAEDEP
jgi:porphobilinogen synthase